MFASKFALALALFGAASASVVPRELTASCDADVVSGDTGLLESDPITVVGTTSDDVTFTVSQVWTSDVLCLVTTYFKAVDETHTCPLSPNVGPGEIAEYTALCEADGFAYVDVFIYDPTLSGDSPSIPAMCEQTPGGSTQKYEFKIPCGTTCTPTEYACADIADKLYNFGAAAEYDDWMFGSSIDGTAGVITLDANTMETSAVFDAPDASVVNMQFNLILPDDPVAGDKVYARVGPYYLDVSDYLTSMAISSQVTTYFAEMLTMIYKADSTTWTFKIQVPGTMVEDGRLTLGFKSDGPLVAQIDDVSVKVDCTDYTSGPAAGGGGGDPHFQRWNREHTSFHGECDLVMVHSDNFHLGTGLDLHVRTTIESYFSYIEMAALKIGRNVAEIHKNFITLDGAEYKPEDLPVTFGTGALTYTISNGEIEENKNKKFYQYYKVDLHDKSSILFKFYKQYLTISISGHAADFSDSVGLLGDYQTGDMISRDGKTMNDYTAYGFEWQVTPEDASLFKEERGPQLPFEQCRMPTAARPARRHLRANPLQDAATEACAHVKGSDFDLCVDDCLTTGDMGLASLW